MNSPPILEPILVVGFNRMFTGGEPIWILTHGHMFSSGLSTGGGRLVPASLGAEIEILVDPGLCLMGKRRGCRG